MSGDGLKQISKDALSQVGGCRVEHTADAFNEHEDVDQVADGRSDARRGGRVGSGRGEGADEEEEGRGGKDSVVVLRGDTF